MIVMDLIDAGAVHLRCEDCGWEVRVDQDIPEREEHAAGVYLTTVLNAAGAHRCPAVPPLRRPADPLPHLVCQVTGLTIGSVRYTVGGQQPYHDDDTPCYHEIRGGGPVPS